MNDVLPELRVKCYFFNHTTFFDLARLKTILREHFCLEEIIEKSMKAKKSLPIGFIITTISDVLPEL